ncbi:MAG: hypothetical protein AAF267_03465 [Deinococcota bacterium]
MGHQISIGEAEIDYDGEAGYVAIHAASAEDIHAPSVGFGYKNIINIHQDTMHIWCELTGLVEVFYNQPLNYHPYNDYKGGAPGVIAINESMHSYLDGALNRWNSTNGKDVAHKLDDVFTRYNKDIFNPYVLREEFRSRLEWFEFWTRWALDNCDHPVMVTR